MKITPKYKLVNLQSNSLKQTKNYVKNLQQQLEKSKIAVENITTFKLMQKQLSKKIDEIQTQLHSCMLKINSQNKKQILIELISMMKGEQFQYQTKQKHDDQIISNNLTKHIHKIQYDIQQILQKHNQQIAKINSLKQQANGCRSQRVVYSNLFKKLEKEIKHNEEIYKLQLLKTQEKKLKRLNQTTKFNASILKNQNQKLKQEPISNINMPIIQTHSQHQYSKSINQNQTGNLFITCKQNFTSKATPKKILTTYNDSLLSNNNPKTIANRISISQQQLKKIKVYGGYDSLQQLISHYQCVDQQNNQLSQLIQETNSQIEKIQNLNERMQKQKINEVYNNKLICQRKSENPTEYRYKQQNNEESTLFQIVNKLAQILHIPQQQSILDHKTHNQAFTKIDYKIQALIEGQQNKENINKNRQETNMSDTIIECLLERMDPVQDYKVIMDQIAFKQQYYYQINKEINKELGKGKRLPKPKKL